MTSFCAVRVHTMLKVRRVLTGAGWLRPEELRKLTGLNKAGVQGALKTLMADGKVVRMGTRRCRWYRWAADPDPEETPTVEALIVDTIEEQLGLHPEGCFVADLLAALPDLNRQQVHDGLARLRRYGRAVQRPEGVTGAPWFKP